jgi:ABC-type phosphate/phosphonate transport system substrate-binding protein
MNWRKLTKGVVLILLAYLEVGASYAEGNKQHVTIQIVPCCDVVMSFKKFHPLVTYLRQATGLDVELVTLRDHSEFEWSVKNGDVDFVLQDPHTYVMLSKFLDKTSLLSALSWDGKRTQSGLIVARKDSGIKGVKDLTGKNVMFGPKLSVVKWIAAKELLRENGINIDSD